MPADGNARPDTDRLTEYFKALANPTRLELLWVLQTPKTAGDVELEASDAWGDHRAGRTLDRSTVHRHLSILEEVGVVERLANGTYVVDQQSLFSVLEELGGLASLRPVVDVDVEETRAAEEDDVGPLPEGPRLVIVGGPRHGRALALEGSGPWVLGRGPETDLRLGYDPHVSQRHLEIERARLGTLRVRALDEARNPPSVDNMALEPGSRVPLEPGSILSVGYSHLVFQPG